MGSKKVIAVVGLLVGLSLTGVCVKWGLPSLGKNFYPKILAKFSIAGHNAAVPQKVAASPGSAAGVPAGNVHTNLNSRDLGELTLTNHYQTCVMLGAGKNCLFTPKMIDAKNVQLTLAVETKTAKGKIHDLSITQIVTRSGRPFEVAVGGFNLSLTPNVISE